MRVYEPDRLVFQKSTVTAIWLALMDYVEQTQPFLLGHDPWQESVTIGGVSRSVQFLYIELLARCAKVINRANGPAFRLRTVTTKVGGCSVADASLSGSVLLKTVQVIYAFRDCLPLHFENVHPLVGSLVWMLEKVSFDNVAQPVEPMTDRSLGGQCVELLFRHGNAFFSTRGHSLADDDDIDRIERINSLIVAFRKMARRQSAKIRLWERPTERRRQKLMSELLPLVDNGMTQFYVVGLDLGLGTDGALDDQEPLREFFQQFMNNLRFKPQISKRLLRVIWRFAVDIDGASRYHCLFIFDGSLIGTGPKFAELIGAYWQVEITLGQGQWSDWSRHPSISCRSTVGCIDLSDRNKVWVFMDRVMSFFADFYLYTEPLVKVPSGTSERAKLRMIGSRRFSSR